MDVYLYYVNDDAKGAILADNESEALRYARNELFYNRAMIGVTGLTVRRELYVNSTLYKRSLVHYACLHGQGVGHTVRHADRYVHTTVYATAVLDLVMGDIMRIMTR